MRYDRFVTPRGVGLTGELAQPGEGAEVFAELLRPTTARVLARYSHPAWGDCAAITENAYGAGRACHLGCMTGPKTLRAVLLRALEGAGVDVTEADAPVAVRRAYGPQGRAVRFYLNYSAGERRAAYRGAAGGDLHTGAAVQTGETLTLPPWGVRIIAER